MKVAVVGAGPAGFYAAGALLTKFARAKVDILDKLPVPFGLVRYGVAPDHAPTRNVQSQFSRMMHEHDNRLSFNGNINVEFCNNHVLTSISSGALTAPTIAFDQLRQLYDLTIVATGAARPRSLNDAGALLDSAHVFAAHDFVLWLNGHPDLHAEGSRATVGDAIAKALKRASDCTVIGAGNVAIDIARNTLRPYMRSDGLLGGGNAASITKHRRGNGNEIKVEVPDSENSKDKELLSQASEVFDSGVCLSAWNVMKDIDVSNVNVIARRAPHHAAWTTAALREIVTKVAGVRTRCDHEAVNLSMREGRDRKTKRMLDVLSKHTTDMRAIDTGEVSTDRRESDADKTLTLLFNHSLEGFGDGCVSFTNGAVVNTDVTFLSLGYESPDVERVGGDDGSAVAAVGWANGSARGIIGDNKWDAETVVAGLDGAAIERAAEQNGRKPGLSDWVKQHRDRVVSWDGWQRIQAEEALRGEQLTGRPGHNVRIESVSEMLRVANG